MLSEIKVALRGLAKSPGFTAIAIATLALAIGANSAVFSLINALLVRPLPYQEPSRIALISLAIKLDDGQTVWELPLACCRAIVVQAWGACIVWPDFKLKRFKLLIRSAVPDGRVSLWPRLNLN